MSRVCARALAAALAATALAGCGAAGSSTATSSRSAIPRAHPQAIEPAAGSQALATTTGSDLVGDVNAHAPSLAEVKRQLKRLNLCGGTTNAADAQPIVVSKTPGFVADPGTIQTVGELPALTSRLNALAQALGVTIYGISGYRTPAHSVAVGGYADDPHTKGLAEDIGVNTLLRSSAAQVTEAELARYGLYRPFDPSDDPNNTEVNHIQLIPAGGPLSLAQSTATFDPDPSCD